MATIRWRDTAQIEAEAWEQALADLRAKRDRLLRESDWTQLPDAPVGSRQEWASYRQSLRDLPEQAVGRDASEVRAISFPAAP